MIKSSYFKLHMLKSAFYVYKNSIEYSIPLIPLICLRWDKLFALPMANYVKTIAK